MAVIKQRLRCKHCGGFASGDCIQDMFIPVGAEDGADVVGLLVSDGVGD